jgi:hypothetical protein
LLIVHWHVRKCIRVFSLERVVFGIIVGNPIGTLNCCDK